MGPRDQTWQNVILVHFPDWTLFPPKIINVQVFLLCHWPSPYVVWNLSSGRGRLRGSQERRGPLPAAGREAATRWCQSSPSRLLRACCACSRGLRSSPRPLTTCLQAWLPDPTRCLLRPSPDSKHTRIFGSLVDDLTAASVRNSPCAHSTNGRAKLHGMLGEGRNRFLWKILPDTCFADTWLSKSLAQCPITPLPQVLRSWDWIST